MDLAAYKKHKRSYSISRFEELNLDLLQKKGNFEEFSTKESPERETPIQLNYLTEVNHLIDLIIKEKNQKEIEKAEKIREIRKLVINELNKNQSIQNEKKQKKRKMNNSVGKITTSVEKVAKVKKFKVFGKVKPKKLILKKAGENPVKIFGSGKNSTKSGRGGSNDIR